jgi:hypothetical protein
MVAFKPVADASGGMGGVAGSAVPFDWARLDTAVIFVPLAKMESDASNANVVTQGASGVTLVGGGPEQAPDATSAPAPQPFRHSEKSKASIASV